MKTEQERQDQPGPKRFQIVHITDPEEFMRLTGLGGYGGVITGGRQLALHPNAPSSSRVTSTPIATP